jgi:AraC family transcriptional regulator of arabinose operon
MMAKQNLGSSYPLFPRTGYVRYEREDAAWAEHDLKNWNVYFTFFGAGEVLFADEMSRSGIGTMMLFPPRLERSYRVANPRVGWGFYFLHFRPSKRLKGTLPWFDRPRPQIFDVRDPTARNRTIASLEEMFQVNLRCPEMALRPALIEGLLEGMLLRVAGAIDRSGTAGRGVDHRVERAIEVFHNDFGKRHSIDSLARVSGLSRSQFCLLFRAGLGRSPQVYIEERRLELARFHLMTTAASVAEIAANVGFEDPFYFCTRFKRRFDLSPSSFRQANRKLGSDLGVWTPELKPTTRGYARAGR